MKRLLTSRPCQDALHPLSQAPQRHASRAAVDAARSTQHKAEGGRRVMRSLEPRPQPRGSSGSSSLSHWVKDSGSRAISPASCRAWRRFRGARRPRRFACQGCKKAAEWGRWPSGARHRRCRPQPAGTPKCNGKRCLTRCRLSDSQRFLAAGSRAKQLHVNPSKSACT
jgi:hypothetical protein